MNPTVSIVVPTYKEADTIPVLAEAIKHVLLGKYRYELVVVDDNSPDGTYHIAKKLKNCRPICRRDKKGLSSAVVDGINHARGQFVVVMDADLSHPPFLIPQLLAALAKSDLAIGSRLVSGGKVQHWPVHRKALSLGARLLARPLTSVKDTMSGFFAFRKKLLADAVLEPYGYKILLEILIKVKPKRVFEVPYTFVNRQLGKSKISGKVCREYLHHITKLYLHKFL